MLGSAKALRRQSTAADAAPEAAPEGEAPETAEEEKPADA